MRTHVRVRRSGRVSSMARRCSAASARRFDELSGYAVGQAAAPGLTPVARRLL
jgi:hypothetical protein